MKTRIPADLPRTTLGTNNNVLLDDLVDGDTQLVLMKNPDGQPYTDQTEGITLDVQRQRIKQLTDDFNDDDLKRIGCFYRQRILTASRSPVENYLLNHYEVIPITNRSIGSTQASDGTNDIAFFSKDKQENIRLQVISKDFQVSNRNDLDGSQIVIPGEVTSVFLLTDEGFKLDYIAASNTLLDDMIMRVKNNVPLSTIVEYATNEENVPETGIPLGMFANKPVMIEKIDFLSLLKRLRNEIHPHAAFSFFVEFCQKHTILENDRSHFVEEIRRYQLAKFNVSLICKTDDSFTPQQVILNYIEHHSLNELEEALNVRPEITTEIDDAAKQQKAVTYAVAIASYLNKLTIFSPNIQALLEEQAGRSWMSAQKEKLLAHLNEDASQADLIIHHSRFFYLSDALTVQDIYHSAFQQACFTPKTLSETALNFLLHPQKIEETLAFYKSLTNRALVSDEKRRIEVLKASYNNDVETLSSSHQHSGRIVEGHLFDTIYENPQQHTYSQYMMTERTYHNASSNLLAILHLAIDDAKKMTDCDSTGKEPIRFCLVASLSTTFLKTPVELLKSIGNPLHPFSILTNRLVQQLTEAIQENKPQKPVNDLETFEKISLKIIEHANYAMRDIALPYYQCYYNHISHEYFSEEDIAIANILFDEIKRDSQPTFTKKIVCDRIQYLLRDTSFDLNKEGFYAFGSLSPSSDPQYFFWGSEGEFKHGEYLKKVAEFLDHINVNAHYSTDIQSARKIIAHVLVNAHQNASLAIQKNSLQLFFNYLNTVIGKEIEADQDMRLDIIEKTKQYLLLETEFNSREEDSSQKTALLEKFVNKYELLIKSGKANMNNFISLFKKQRDNFIVDKIFEEMKSHFKAISDDIRGESDSEQYVAIVETFFYLHDLYEKISFCNLIIQVPRWIQNIRNDHEFSNEDKNEIHRFCHSIFLDNFDLALACSKLASILDNIDIKHDEFISLSTYMADYLYKETSEKRTSSMMSMFLKASHYRNPSPLNDTDDALQRFFLAKLVSPNDKGELFKALSEEGLSDFSLLLLSLYRNEIKNDLPGPLAAFYTHATNQYSLSGFDSSDKMNLAGDWGKQIITEKDQETEIPFGLKIAVMQSIFLNYYKEGRHDKDKVYAEIIFILALSFSKQKPRNIYMACQFFGDLSSFNLDSERQEEIIEVLDLLEDEGFLCQKNALEKFNEQDLQRARENVISKRILKELECLSVEITNNAENTTRSPIQNSISGELGTNYPNLFSLKRMSESKGFDNRAFPVFNALWKKMNQEGAQGFYLYISQEKISLFPKMKKEIEDFAENKYGLYAMVIAYLISEEKDFYAERSAINSAHDSLNAINNRWIYFLDVYFRRDISQSFCALEELEKEYKQHRIPLVGQKAITAIKKAIVPKIFRDHYATHYLSFVSIFNHLTESAASTMLNFLINHSKNSFIPFMLNQENLTCLTIDKKLLGSFSSLTHRFESFFESLKQFTLIKNHSILVMLLEISEKSVLIHEFNIIGFKDPDLFNFALHLRHDKNQKSLAQALMPYVSKAPDLGFFFSLFSQESEHDNSFKVEDQIRNMIKQKKESIKLISRSKDHLRLAFIIYQNANMLTTICDSSFSYFILQEPEALVALFFITELSMSTYTTDQMRSMMNFLVLTCHPLNIRILYDNIQLSHLSPFFAKEIKHIGEKKSSDQVSYAIRFFENKNRYSTSEFKSEYR